MRSRIPAMAKKEFLHVLRDWRSLAMAFAMPMIMILLFGYAITFDIRNVRLAVYDADRGPASRELVDRFTGNGYFRLVATAVSEDELDGFIQRGEAQIALSIPDDFAERASRGERVEMAVIVDGSESNTATIAGNYVIAILEGYGRELATRRAGGARVGTIEWKPRFWFNDELRSQNFLVPGLVATIMMIMTALLTSLTIVREREHGSLEQLIATPVRRYEIVIGKLIPYFVIGVLDSILVAGVGIAAFDVPFTGSVALYLLATSVFALAGLGIGLFISCVSKNQLMAMQIAILASMLPSYLLSGFMFAIKNMPSWVQTITLLVPARYFLVVLRGIFLKDSGIDILWPQIALLAALAVVMLGAAVGRFKKTLE
ncbi:MAG: ABC transporter permease [Deltaproteobacteria bacterium]|nr:ABC transporter permease [Deltaproteobacteria bacterium]